MLQQSVPDCVPPTATVEKTAPGLHTEKTRSLLHRVLEGVPVSIALPVRGIQAVCSRIERIVSGREAQRPHSDGIHRTSNLSVRAALILLLTAGLAAKVADDLQTVEQPSPLPTATRLSFVGEGDFPLPSSDDDIETVMQQLDSPRRTSEFLSKNVTSDMPGFPVRFLRTYRKNPETLLGDGAGACNAYANFFGEWAARRRVTSYTLTICPRNPASALWNPWHQVQVVRIRDGRFLIVDNGQCIYCDGGLQVNVKRLYPDMAVIPYGGCVPWKRTTETAIGGLSIHAQRSVDESEMEVYPELDSTFSDRPVLAYFR